MSKMRKGTRKGGREVEMEVRKYRGIMERWGSRREKESVTKYREQRQIT